MPFKTDSAWTPETYRRAYAAWLANAPSTDGPIFARNARTDNPKSQSLSEKLRALLVWRSITDPEPELSTSWMRHDVRADNDNFDDDASLPLLDCEYEIRPSVPELARAWRGTTDAPINYRPGIKERCDNPQAPTIRPAVAVGGDIDVGVHKSVPELAASEIDDNKPARSDRAVVTRIGALEFSNGQQVERCTVLKFGKAARGEVRMPAGALIRFKGRVPVERYRAAKGASVASEPTVGHGTGSVGSGLCPDPLEARDWSEAVRRLVGTETAKVLDLAVRAANFREVGEAHGKRGKHAERFGRAVVEQACARLDEVLVAANDNRSPSTTAAA